MDSDKSNTLGYALIVVGISMSIFVVLVLLCSFLHWCHVRKLQRKFGNSSAAGASPTHFTTESGILGGSEAGSGMLVASTDNYYSTSCDYAPSSDCAASPSDCSASSPSGDGGGC